MEPCQGSVVEVIKGGRRYRSPNRVLARTFRLGRDKWKQKHHTIQAELEQTRQLAAERGASRDGWRERFEAEMARAEAAEALAAQRLTELEQFRARVVQLETDAQKKTR
jgi:hypothetical protein